MNENINTNTNNANNLAGKNTKIYENPVVKSLNSVRGFDPTNYLINISPEGSLEEELYLKVEIQILWFRLKNPTGVISTKLVSLDNKKAVFEAAVYLSQNEQALANGFAARNFDPTYDIYGERYVEWAETAAVGRALDKAGYGIQFANTKTYNEFLLISQKNKDSTENLDEQVKRIMDTINLLQLNNLQKQDTLGTIVEQEIIQANNQESGFNNLNNNEELEEQNTSNVVVQQEVIQANNQGSGFKDLNSKEQLEEQNTLNVVVQQEVIQANNQESGFKNLNNNKELEEQNTSNVIVPQKVIQPNNQKNKLKENKIYLKIGNKNSIEQLKNLNKQEESITNPIINPKQEKSTTNPIINPKQEESTANPIISPKQEESTANSSISPKQEESITNPIISPKQEESITNPIINPKQEESITNPIINPKQEESTANSSILINKKSIKISNEMTEKEIREKMTLEYAKKVNSSLSSIKLPLGEMENGVLQWIVNNYEGIDKVMKIAAEKILESLK